MPQGIQEEHPLVQLLLRQVVARNKHCRFRKGLDPIFQKCFHIKDLRFHVSTHLPRPTGAGSHLLSLTNLL